VNSDKPISRKTRLVDIAKACGVSTVAVSYALSGKKGVSEEVRKTILSKAREMHYHEEKEWEVFCITAASNMKMSNSYYWRVYKAIESQNLLLGMETSLELLSEDDEKTGRIPILLRNHPCAVAVIIGKLSIDYVRTLIAHGIQLLLFDTSYRDLNVPTVLMNDYYDMYRLTDCLLGCGHRSIGFFGAIHYSSVTEDRYLGYVKALFSHQISPNVNLEISDRDENGKEKLICLPEHLPTAFVCVDVFAARLLIHALKERFIEPNRDITVVLFGDYPQFPLSSICVTESRVALCIADTLLSMKKKKPLSSNRILLSGDLKVNTSISPSKRL